MEFDTEPVYLFTKRMWIHAIYHMTLSYGPNILHRPIWTD